MSFIKRVMDVIEVIADDLRKTNNRLDAFTGVSGNGGNSKDNNNNNNELVNIITVRDKKDSLSENTFTSKVNIANLDNTITTTKYIRDFDGIIKEIITTTKPA